jgi:hypothetical protein
MSFLFSQLTPFVEGVKVDRWLNFRIGTRQTERMALYVSSVWRPVF